MIITRHADGSFQVEGECSLRDALLGISAQMNEAVGVQMRCHEIGRPIESLTQIEARLARVRIYLDAAAKRKGDGRIERMACSIVPTISRE